MIFKEACFSSSSGPFLEAKRSFLAAVLAFSASTSTSL
jgi:hypothetical protein